MGAIVATQSRTEIHLNLDKIVSDLTTDTVLKVGWPKNIQYPAKQGGQYVATVAAIHEFGAPQNNIPPRPFLTPAIAENKTAWLLLAEKGAKRAIKGDETILTILEKIGARASTDVKKAIQNVTSPPLLEKTIAARKRRYLSKAKNKKVLPKYIEKPLIDTGVMFESVSFAVEPE